MPSSERLRPMPFILGGAVCALAFTAAYLFFVRSYIGQLVDETAFTGARDWPAGLTRLTRDFLDLLPYVAVGVTGVLSIVLAALHRAWKVFAVAVGAAIAANLSAQVLKAAILNRAHTGVADGLANSFPSGHTTVAASGVLVLFLLVPQRLRPVVGAIGGLFAIAAGASTLVNLWHRPSDIAGGLLLVAFWGCVAGVVLAALDVPTRAPARARVPGLAVVTIVLAVLGTIAFVITWVGVLDRSAHFFIAYAGSIVAIAAIGFALVVCGSRMFRRLA